MSGIAVLHAPGDGSLSGRMETMLQTMEHRGPDGRGQWLDQDAALGHLLLTSLPEADLVTQPLVRGELVLVADCRIDNREELFGEQVSDAETILRAYERWGEECPAHLRGDFVFAIWDSAQRRLVCGRDHFGVKPLYWCFSAGIFAAASEVKALLSLPEVGAIPDEQMIANHLREDLDDPEVTYWRGISRLPPAHTLTLEGSGEPRKRRYWRLSLPDGRSTTSADEEYEQTLRRLFIRAVKRRMRATGQVGSALSGGLDSSAITSTAGQLAREHGEEVHAFSLIFPTLAHLDERRWIEPVLGDPAIVGHFIEADVLNPFEVLDQMLWHCDGFAYSPGLYRHWALLAEVRRHDLKVFLDGFDGDSTLHHGQWYPLELFLRGRCIAAFKEVLWHARRQDEPVATVLMSLAEATIIYTLRGVARRILGVFGIQRRASSRVASDRVHRTPRSASVEAYRRPPSLLATDQSVHLREISRPSMTVLLEAADRVAAAHRVEPRYPFFDLDLVECCLGIPSRLKLHDGYSRWVMRRAMSGILPPEVQWRPGKTNFSWVLTQALHRHGRPAMAALLSEPGPLAPFVDMTTLRQIWERFEAEPNPRDDMDLWLTIVLHRGLTSPALFNRPSLGA